MFIDLIAKTPQYHIKLDLSAVHVLHIVLFTTPLNKPKTYSYIFTAVSILNGTATPTNNKNNYKET